MIATCRRFANDNLLFDAVGAGRVHIPDVPPLPRRPVLLDKGKGTIEKTPELTGNKDLQAEGKAGKVQARPVLTATARRRDKG